MYSLKFWIKVMWVTLFLAFTGSWVLQFASVVCSYLLCIFEHHFIKFYLPGKIWLLHQDACSLKQVITGHQVRVYTGCLVTLAASSPLLSTCHLQIWSTPKMFIEIRQELWLKTVSLQNYQRTLGGCDGVLDGNVTESAEQAKKYVKEEVCPFI